MIREQAPIKIMDGLFLTNEFNADNEEFMILNHVELVINCNPHQIDPSYRELGIIDHLLQLEGQYAKIQPLQLYELIASYKQHGGSVVILTHQAYNSAFIIAALYLIQKFQWSLYKSLQYLSSKLSSVQLNEHDYNILKLFEIELISMRIPLSFNWEETPSNKEELVVRNTYVNSWEPQKQFHHKEINKVCKTKKKKNKRVSFNFQLQQSVSGCKINNGVKMSVQKILQTIKTSQKSRVVASRSLTSLNKQKSTYNFLKSEEQTSKEILDTKDTDNEDQQKYKKVSQNRLLKRLKSESINIRPANSLPLLKQQNLKTQTSKQVKKQEKVKKDKNIHMRKSILKFLNNKQNIQNPYSFEKDKISKLPIKNRLNGKTESFKSIHNCSVQQKTKQVVKNSSFSEFRPASLKKLI